MSEGISERERETGRKERERVIGVRVKIGGACVHTPPSRMLASLSLLLYSQTVPPMPSEWACVACGLWLHCSKMGRPCMSSSIGTLAVTHPQLRLTLTLPS